MALVRYGVGWFPDIYYPYCTVDGTKISESEEWLDEWHELDHWIDRPDLPSHTFEYDVLDLLEDRGGIEAVPEKYRERVLAMIASGKTTRTTTIPGGYSWLSSGWNVPAIEEAVEIMVERRWPGILAKAVPDPKTICGWVADV